MGIKDLNTLVKKYGDPTIYKKVKAEEMKGKRFAVDISIFICGFVMTSQENWFNLMTNFLLNLRKHKVNAIIVFDGLNVPKEKLIEREGRKNAQQNQKVRLEKLKFFKEKLMMHCFDGNDICLVPERLQEEFKEIFKRTKHSVNPRDAEDVLTFVSEKVDKAKQVAEGIKEHHKTMTRTLVKSIGLPYIEADGEAEALASSMAYKGIVDGVISRDTDTLVYGAPLLVTDIKDGIFSCVYLQDMLNVLQMNMSQFIDMCICLQCDYNARMPKHGMVTVFKAIKEYGSIDNWKENHPDKPFHLLKYNRCREIFRPYSKKYFEKKCKIRKAKKVDVVTLNELFDTVDSKYTGEYIEKVMSGECDPSYRGNWGSIIKN